MKYINVINELNGEDYEVILATSYGINLSFFEKLILRNLKDKDCTYIGLYVDSIINESLEYDQINELGKSYLMRPIQLKKTFHSKVFILLGENKAKLIMGSGNITSGGLISNIEFFNKFEFDSKKNNNYLELIISSYNFFKKLHSLYPSEMMDKVFNKITDYSYLESSTKETINKNIYFIHNLNNSIYSQIRNIIKEDIKSVDIMVPYFDQNLMVIEKILEEIKPLEINIYIQDNTSNFPLDKNLFENVFIHKITFKNNKNRRYHGKLISLNCGKNDYLIYGSANCSNPALLKSLNKKGNVETVILERVNSGYFKKNIKNLISVSKITNEFKVIDSSEYKVKNHEAAFIEAINKENQFVLYLESKEEIKNVLINNKEGKITKLNKNIFKIIWRNNITHNNSIFKSKVVFSNGAKTIIKGWINHEMTIIKNQTSYNKYVYSSLKNDSLFSNIDKLVVLFEDLMDRMILEEKDLDNKIIKTKSNIRHNKEKDEIAENSISKNIDDYFVDADLNDKSIYGSLQEIDLLGNLIKLLLEPFRVNSENEGFKTNKSKTIINRKTLNENDNAIENLEKRIKKFVNKFNNGINSERYLNNITKDIYIKNILIYTGFLWRLYNFKNEIASGEKDNIKIKNREDKQKNLIFLDDKFIINKIIEVINSFVYFVERNLITDFEDVDNLLSQFIIIITAKHLEIKNSNLNIKEKKVKRKQLSNLLRKINKYFKPIRENYNKYFNEGIKYKNIIFKNQDIQLNQLIKEFEDLLDFYTFKSFVNYCKNETLFQYKNMNIKDTSVEIEITIENGKNEKDLSLIKLQIVSKMLSVLEWEDKNLFIIKIFYEQHDHIVYRSIEYAKREKYIIKKTSYKNGRILYEKKTNVSLYKIVESAEKFNTSILTQDFTCKFLDQI